MTHFKRPNCREVKSCFIKIFVDQLIFIFQLKFSNTCVSGTYFKIQTTFVVTSLGSVAAKLASVNVICN